MPTASNGIPLRNLALSYVKSLTEKQFAEFFYEVARLAERAL